MQKIIFSILCAASFSVRALIGPLPIYLNTEYRTDNPIIPAITNNITIDENAIKSSGANSFLELIQTLPELNTFNAVGNVPSIFMRGTESNHSLILIDGVKIQDISAPTNLPALDIIPLDNIAKIEIIKSSSVLYGSSAIGGVINITTKKGVSNNTLSINFAENNSKKYSLNLYNGDNKNYVKFISGGYETAGISALKNNDEKDGIKEHNANLIFGLDINDFKIGIDILKNNNITEYDDSFGTNHNKYLDKNLEKSTIKIVKNKTKILYSKISQRKTSYTNNIIDFWNNKKYQTTDLTFLHDFNFNNNLITLGLTKLKDESITDSFSLGSDDIFLNYQKSYNFADINLGLRNTKHNKFGNKLIYDLAVAKNISGIKLTAKYGTAFNSPSLYQLLNADAFATGNPNLKPESATNIELGISKIHSWGELYINLYKTDIKDIIIYEDTATVDYFNKDKLVSKGLELGINTIINDYNLNFNYHYNESNLNNQDAQSLRRPKHILGLKIKKFWQGFDNNLSINYRSKRNDTSGVELASYTLVDLGSSYKINDKTKINFGINNLFNKDYEHSKGYNTYGRVFNLGFTHKF